MTRPDRDAIYRGKLALVTGASSGIGAAFARELVLSGADLVITARREARLNDLAVELRQLNDVNVEVLAADLSIPNAATDLVRKLVSNGRHIDILINCAGTTVADRFKDSGQDEQDRFLATNVQAPVQFMHAVYDGMISRHYGRILNVSSIMAFLPGGAGHTLYPAAKSFLLRASQSLSVESRGTGVNICALCPGSTATEFRSANGIGAASGNRKSAFVQTAEQVAQTGMRGLEKSRVVIVPGWHNKLAVMAFRTIPSGFIHWMERRFLSSKTTNSKGA